ncbi:MAG: UDPGP type 1 family protein [Planctomycetes bacterium]|nr:UDPGP type 1 family protein [Planctomycetota bacterium]
MASHQTLASRYDAALATLQGRGQNHVVRWWDELGVRDKEHLLGQIEAVPWDVLDRLIPTHVQSEPHGRIPTDLRPAPVFPSTPNGDQEKLYATASQRGRELIAAGKVAAFTVAGGQGTRLGFDGPKGALPVTPIGGQTLFELFADSIQAARRAFDCSIPWYVMTSQANHQATVRFFEEHDYFGLPEEDVALFEQGMLPALDFKGRLLLDRKDGLALAPDGHGGSLKALARSGALSDARQRGCSILSYFQVDNPLVKPFDPLFIGLHASTGSEMSTKVTRKADDLERVGNLCLADGRLTVIEYTEFPQHLAGQKNPDGRRTFDAGNIAIHLLDVSFVERLVAESLDLPFRRAEKVVPYIDESGRRVEPDKPNAVKLEKFVFDALPLAKNPLVLEVERAEEFSPIKNAAGVDSLETAQRAQIARACRWLESAGVAIPRKSDGTPDVTIEIAPSFALDAGEIQSKRDRLPLLRPGGSFYLQ